MKGKRLAMLKPNSSGQKEVHSQMERNSTNEDGHEERPMCRRSAKHFRIPKMKRYFKRGKKKSVTYKGVQIRLTSVKLDPGRQ